jgi:apoptosis regulator BAX
LVLKSHPSLCSQEGLLSYFGTPTWQTVTIFVAGVLTASLTIWKKMG